MKNEAVDSMLISVHSQLITAFKARKYIYQRCQARLENFKAVKARNIAF